DVSALLVTAPLATPGLQQSTDQMNEEGRMTASGFFLGVIGMLAGAAVGSGIGSAACDDRSNCVTRYASGGAAIVGALTVPVGVHVAADQPKRLPLTMLASVGVGGAIWGVINAVPGRPVPLAPFIAAPLQIWVSTRLERSR
ncbi:MAG TPA: hypothetical protein VK864_15775, partial [Longimicrobiales bacterium]|nr:hypothetical protein [Longimicrobiales bacterium]